MDPKDGSSTTPVWAEEFPVNAAEDAYVQRRQFTKFLVLTSFGMVAGNRATLRGMNVVGMRRAGFGRSDVQTLRLAYRRIFDRQHPLADNLARARAEFAGVPLVEKVIAFMDGRDKRPFCLPPVGRSIDDGSDDED